MTEEIPASASTLYGEFSSIFKEDGKWTVGGYRLPNGGFWTYNEPDAIVHVQHNRLRVRIEPLTRNHDTIQLLDNSKHVYLSTTRFPTPEEGSISFEIQMNAEVKAAKDNDLYSGFTTFSLHDLEGGFGLSFLTNGREFASLYSRQAPESITSKSPTYPRFFEIYAEHPLNPASDGPHNFTINYTKKDARAEWLVDGEQVNSQNRIPDPINTLIMSIGVMTAVDLGPQGSRSIHGQGVRGEWSEIKITAANTLQH